MNKEKVIKGLKQHKDGWLHSCDNCPYASDANCQFKLYFDALTLIEEQEAIIEQYHRADGFLAVHGWKWEER
jgi:hypothetical protein